jgi:outer membrane receptor protein involved in Fe transport
MTHNFSFKAGLALSAAAFCFATPVMAQDADVQAPPNTDTITPAAPTPQTPEDEVIVVGRFIPTPQRATSQVASFLQPEDLVRQGDSNAALALTRVSGISVVGGKFAYVRGLGDRYSSALLNGSPLPSPQPLRRTVPLDLFPSSVLNNIAVQKTYSPNYPGEFGGGVIDLRTLRSPVDDFFNVKVGASYNSVSTFEPAIFVRGGDRDIFGFDDGIRDIPDPLQGVLSRGESLGDQPDTDLELIGQLLSDPNLTVIQGYDNEDVHPDFSGSIDVGRIIPTSFGELGFVGTLGFENGYTTREAIRQVQANGSVEDQLTSFETSYQATLNALGSLTLTLDSGDSVQGTLFWVHDTTKEAQIDEGTTFSEPDGIFVEKSGWFERELFFSQLNGEHEIGDITANWRGSFSKATRDAPFEREVERQLQPSGDLLFPGNNAHRIGFSFVEDEIYSGGLDLSYPLDFDNGWVVELSGGVDYAQTDRTFTDLNLQYAALTQLDPQVAAARVDVLFSPQTIGTLFDITEVPPRPSDNYLGDLQTLGLYAMADVDFSPEVRVDFGVRYEDSDLVVQTLDRFSNPGVGSQIKEDYLLPSVAFTWNFAESTQLRLGYSDTIARPQFRELALSRFLDPGTERTFQGNPNLVDSQFTNLDAKLERYFGRNQFLTLGLFYKDITNPIEEATFETSANVFETSFINAPSAELFGVEAEFRTNFAMPFDGAFFEDRDWFFTVNYTYTDATVNATADDIIFQANDRPAEGDTGTSGDLFGIDGQPLQGTPENILNTQFGYETENSQLTLLLGWVDERVSRRGLRGLSVVPDVIEDPGVQLDLVYRRSFDIRSKEFNFGLSARNLLDEDFEEFQTSEDAGRTEFNTYQRGRTISASLSTSF